MTIADEIRTATNQNRLHPLVRDNWASPRGLCNSSHINEENSTYPVIFCQLDYGHEMPHINDSHQWNTSWPPPELYHP
jgi:hypothetical protein